MKMFTVSELWSLAERIDDLARYELDASRAADPEESKEHFAAYAAYSRAARSISRLLINGGKYVPPERPISDWGAASLEDLEKNVP